MAALFCCVGCILRAVETSRISVVRDIADRFAGWQQLIANDIPSLTDVPFARGTEGSIINYFYYDFAVAFARRGYL